MLVLVLLIVLALSALHIQASADCAVMGFNTEKWCKSNEKAAKEEGKYHNIFRFENGLKSFKHKCISGSGDEY